MTNSKQAGRKNRGKSQKAPASAPASQTALRGSDTVDWAHEYRYVLGDLRKLAIVSLSLFAVIILIGFFL